MALDDDNAKRLRRLAEVVEKIAAVRDLSGLMSIVRHAVRELTGADGATLVLREDGQCHYVDEDAIGPLWKGQRFPLESCISGWAMLNSAPAVIEDIYADPRIPYAAYRPTFVKSLSMVPIGRKNPVGAIGCYWARQHKATDEEVELQQALADAMSVGLANLDLYKKNEEARQAAERAALQAQTSEAALKVAQRLAGVGNWERDIGAGAYKTWSDELYRIYGRNPSLPPASFDEVREYYTQESWTRVAAAVTKCEAEGIPYECDAEIVRADGSRCWVVARGAAIRDADGNIASMHGTVQDITRRKQAEDEIRKLNADLELRVMERTAKLAAANRAKDAFLATMSHEIRTPLTGILGMLELLSMTALDDKQLETLNAAWDSSRGLLRIVSDVLDWSKIEEGRLELSLRSTSIPQLLQEVVNTYSRVASAKSLVLSQRADARLSPAHIVDPLRLSQVLNNFVSNAIKFTPRGKVEVRAELLEQHESGERIRFSVQDTGVGIPQDVQQRLFQRYRQESSDTARMYGGTGLGLAICRRLAEIMDGQIELQSEPGDGATFSVTLVLPVSGAPGEAVPGLHPEVAQRAVKPLVEQGVNAPRILAVDDHPINRDLLARQIELLGLGVETAENGQQALSMWREGRFAMVITDCHMPEMDGYEFTDALRKIEAEENRRRTPVVAWTANALAEEAEHCRLAGMDELLVKPTTMAQLKGVLSKWLAIAEPASAMPEPALANYQPNERPIDYGDLIKVVPDSAEHGRVLREFASHMRADFTRLDEMLARDDYSGIQNVAHRMKGSGRMVGARRLANASAGMEQAAKDSSLQDVREAYLQLKSALEQFEAYMQGGGHECQ